MKKLLVAIPELNDAGKARIAQAGEGCEIRFRTLAEVSAEDVAWANIAMGLIPASLFHENEELEFLQLSSAGADAHVRPGVLREGTVLTCCTGAYSQAVAEHAFAQTLMLQKNLHLYRDAQSRKQWTDAGSVTSMSDSTVLIMGLGDIGRYYATLAKALGAHVIGIKRRASDKPEFVDELYCTADFDKVVGRADVVAAFLPGTKETYHFFTEERFAMMKDSAIFINCGRGTAVSMDALYNALSGHLIRAAGVDVFEKEPLPESSPLWALDNLAVTPHASGFFHLPVTKERVLDICIHNLKAYLTGGKLMNIVDFSTGYKK